MFNHIVKNNDTNINNNNITSNQNNDDQLRASSFSQTPAIRIINSPEERNKILKKILAHFNVKVSTMESKSFMRIFGLDIKPIGINENANRQDNNTQMQNKGQSRNQNNKNLIKNVNRRHISSIIQQRKNKKVKEMSLQQMDEQQQKQLQMQYQLTHQQNGDQNGNEINQKEIDIQKTENYNKNQYQIIDKELDIESQQQQQAQQININSYTCQSNNLISDNQQNQQDSQSQNQGEISTTDTKSGNSSNGSKNICLIQKQQFIVKKSKRSNYNNQPFKFGLNSDNISAKEDIFIKKMQNYRDFLFKINYANYLFVQVPIKEGLFKVFIGRGNNSRLIKTIFRQRWWWTIIDESNKQEANFVWTQLKVEDYLKKMKNCNKIVHEASYQSLQSQVESDIRINSSRKQNKPQSVREKSSDSNRSSPSGKNIKTVNSGNIMINSSQYKSFSSSNGMVQSLNNITSSQIICNSPAKDTQVQQQLLQDPHAKVFNQVDQANFKIYYQLYGKEDQQQDFEDLSYRLKYLIKGDKLIQVEDSTQFKTHNHLPQNYHLGNKKAMFYNMRQYYELQKLNVFEVVPLTFHISKGQSDPEFKNFLKYYLQRKTDIEKQEKMIDSDNYPQSGGKIKKLRNIWIVKPGEVTNRGNGINVCDSLSDIKRILSSKATHQNGKLKTYIVQQYIDRPFLYNRRKFDLRCYMMITSVNGIVRGYWYQEGYIRTSCREFNVYEVGDNFIHLTNDAVQKHADEYGKYETGNKLSFPEFQRYLDMWFPDQKYSFFQQVYPKLKSIATEAIRATYTKLDPLKKETLFEIFGLDFMIDEAFKPWLIEINTNPSLETTCPICTRVIPPMVENAIRIGLDPLFPPPSMWPSHKKHSVPDQLLENNRFELVFDETIDGPTLQQLYQDCANLNYGEIEEEEEEIVDSDEENQKLDQKNGNLSQSFDYD